MIIACEYIYDCYSYQEKINDGMYVNIGYILIRQLKILFVIMY